MKTSLTLFAMAATLCLVQLATAQTSVFQSEAGVSSAQSTEPLRTRPRNFPTAPSAPRAPATMTVPSAGQNGPGIRYAMPANPNAQPLARFPSQSNITTLNRLTTTINGRPTPEQEFTDKIAQAENDSDRDDAIEELKSLLEDQYDDYIANDEQRMNQMRERLEKLEEQLEKRRDAKSRLVDMRLEMLISEADGLGWPRENNFPTVTGWSNVRQPYFTAPASQIAEVPGDRE